MVTLAEAHTIAEGFLKEACDVLGLVAEKVGLNYVPTCEVMGHEMPLVPLPDGTLCVNNAFLQQMLSADSSTPVRTAMYCVAWNAYRPGSSAEEQTTFAMALSMVKGIAPQDDRAITFLGEKNIKYMLSDVFHLDCDIIHAQCEDGSYRYTLKVKKDNNVHQPIPALKVKADYPQPVKGTEAAPFENVDEAAAYIKQLEPVEWEQDAFLQEIVNSHYYYEPLQGSFRIGWASPFVAFYKNDIPDSGFVVNQLASRRFSIKPNLYHHKFLFRGQSKYYDKCYPNLFRDEKKSNFLDLLIWSQELEALVASHPLIQFIEQGIELLHDRFVFEMNYGGLTQHYYNKSPYLDLTSDIESAKFFAVTDYDCDHDEYHVTKETSLGVLYYYSIEMPGAFRTKTPYALSTIGKQIFMRSGNQHGFLLRMEKGVNFNDLPQVRKVFFKHDSAIAQRIFEASDEGRKYFPDDALQAACCERLEVLKKKRTVSLRAVELNQKNNPSETIDSLVAQLKNNGIEVVDTLVPAFPKEYLSREAMQRMWDEFCRDVYFYSPDGLLYQKAMAKIKLLSF